MGDGLQIYQSVGLPRDHGSDRPWAGRRRSNLQGDQTHRLVGMALHQGLRTIDAFIGDELQVISLADAEAFRLGPARLREKNALNGGAVAVPREQDGRQVPSSLDRSAC